MSSREIPLRPRAPQQRFSAPLGDYTLEFSFYWVARFEYFRVNIRDVTGDAFTLTNGRIAHPDVNLLSGLNPRYGRVYMHGQPATLTNLGVRAHLMWEAP